MLERNLSTSPPSPGRGRSVAFLWGGYLLAAKIISLIMGDGDRENVFDETMERSGWQNEPSGVTAGGDGLKITTRTDSLRRIRFVRLDLNRIYGTFHIKKDLQKSYHRGGKSRGDEWVKLYKLDR